MCESIIILNFSGRNGGNCEKICNFISEFHNRTNVAIIKITNDVLNSCGNCCYECLNVGKQCPHGESFSIYEAITNAQLVYFVIPNYCGFPCANYFIFNERSVGFFDGGKDKLENYLRIRKRFILVSNTDSNVMRMAMEQQVYGDPDICWIKSNRYNKRSTDGDILDSDQARNDLREFLEEIHIG